MYDTARLNIHHSEFLTMFTRKGLVVNNKQRTAHYGVFVIRVFKCLIEEVLR